MLQRTALIISTALTMLTLLVALALALRLIMSEPTPVVGDTATAEQTELADQQAEQDAVVRDALDQLNTANQVLAASYQRIDSLSEEARVLQEQNATLRQREATYAARLAEASNRLKHPESAGMQPPDGAANSVADPDPAATTQAPDVATIAPAVPLAPVAPVQAAPNIPPGLSLVVPGRTIPVQPQVAESADARAVAAPSQPPVTAAPQTPSGLQPMLPTIDPRLIANSMSTVVQQSASVNRGHEDDDEHDDEHDDHDRDEDRKERDKEKKREATAERRERSNSREGR